MRRARRVGEGGTADARFLRKPRAHAAKTTVTDGSCLRMGVAVERLEVQNLPARRWRPLARG